MIKAVLYRKACRVVGFRITGHAGYAAHGEDIVCSAVSMLAQTTVLGLTEIVGVETELRIDEGEIYCMLRDDGSEEGKRHDAELLISTMEMGLTNIEKNYGKYLNVTQWEVT